MKQINNDDFESKVLLNEKLVLVYWSAIWCRPCKMILPMLEQFEIENPTIDIFKIDVDENKKLTSDFMIKSIPTILVFKNGKEINRKTGLKSKSELTELIMNKILSTLS